MKTVVLSLLILLIPASTALQAGVGSIHRELRRMRGYVIVDTSSVAEDRNGQKVVKLTNGNVFTISGFALLTTFSDVAVFAKPLAGIS